MVTSAPPRDRAAAIEQYKGWNVIMLVRRDPSPLTGGDLDALVFIQGQPEYRYVRRQNADHVLEFGAHKGHATAVLTEQNIAHYQEIIKREKLGLQSGPASAPGKIYCSLRPCFFSWDTAPGQELTLELRDRPERIDNSDESEANRIMPSGK